MPAVLLLVGALLAQTHAPQCPNVVVVFDVSASMTVNYSQSLDGGSKMRYTVGVEAIERLIRGSISARYGLELFGDLSVDNDTCGVSSPTCFYPSPGCESVLAGSSTAGAISTVLENAIVQGYTPTTKALRTAGTRADLADAGRTRYILLVTDGDPGCGEDDTVDGSVSVLEALRNTQGVKTFVVGFSGDTSAALDAMAKAGGTAQCDAGATCYFAAYDERTLTAALQAISFMVQGELGGQDCDDSCYGQGCPPGHWCVRGDAGPACQPNPCAAVTCDAGSSCLDGTCRRACATACLPGQRCQDGTCMATAPCDPVCALRNQVCVDGRCVEDHCSVLTGGDPLCTVSMDCEYNGCQAWPDGGTLQGPIDAGVTDAGTDSGKWTMAGAGCCSGAPGAFSVVCLLGVWLAFALRRRWPGQR